jgi:hypothetical protein
MISGIGIPVITPFKFYPVSRTLGNGVNFQNVDNTERDQQDWEGVYPNKFVQPVPRYWNDYSYGIDFQIILDTTVLPFANFSAELVDTNGDKVIDLVSVDFFTNGDTKTVRVYAENMNFDDGCYRISLLSSSTEVYYSEYINIQDTHVDCYPFEYSNFENDFGLIFENASNVTWSGKILVPMRIYEPIPREEKESYINDPGEVVTLRSVPQRYYKIETYAVATWFAELFKMAFNCSELILNKSNVNTEENPELELIPQSDLIQIEGDIALNDFVDQYIQEENIDTLTELLSSWTPSGSWTTFVTNGKDITLALYEAAGTGTCSSNSVSLTEDQYYLIVLDITGTMNNGGLTIGTDNYDLIVGTNTIIHQGAATSSYNLVIQVGQDSDFSAECSMLKID